MPDLGELLHVDAIGLDVSATDWEQAIRLSGQLLEGTEVATADYTEAMVDSVHEHGPYIVVAPGFAFAHARPSDAVHRTGLAWLRLAEPVEFGHRSNDPVRLVVAMAATDSDAHQSAMAQLARLLADTARREQLDRASSGEEVLAILADDNPAPTSSGGESQPAAARSSGGAGSTKNHIMTVCGNGVGTSLFLKNTLEQVLNRWGWSSYVTAEATDTVSARGKAKDADFILTSAEIARTLGDVGVPVRVIENFTSTTEIDTALREMYDV